MSKSEAYAYISDINVMATMHGVIGRRHRGTAAELALRWNGIFFREISAQSQFGTIGRMTNRQLTAQLKQLTAGLWLPSETEAPWTVPTWTLTTGDAAEIRQVLRRAEDVSVTESSLDELMAQIKQRCRAYGPEGKAIHQQHQTLFDYLQTECDRVRVFRVGTVTIDVVIVGETADGYGILQTQSVET